MEALEISGNKIINQCYEALITNEKEGRHKRKYGQEAYFFEKFVNRTYFDQVLYRQVMTESCKSLVEKRVNQQLRGFNVRKMNIGEDPDPDGSDEDDHPESRKNSRERHDRDAREGMEKTESSRNMRDRRTLQKKRLSARNIFSIADDDNQDSQSVATTSRRGQLSSARMNSLRRDVMGEKDDRRSRGMQRAKSNPRLSMDSDERASRKDARANMRRAASNPRLQVQQARGDGNASGMRRTGSRRRLGTSNSNRNLSGSFSSLKMTDNDGDDDTTNRQNARFGGARRSNSRAKLNASKTGLSFANTGDDDDDDDQPILTKRQSSQRALAHGLKF